MRSERYKKKRAVTLLCGLLFACSTALYVPKESPKVSKSELEWLMKGRKDYIRKCGSCHNLILPEKHSEEEWKVILEKMAKRSHLTSDEFRSIQNYVTSPARNK